MNKYRYKNEIILLCDKDALTAKQIYGKLKKNYENLGIGTVYRNLSELIKEGKIEKIHGVSNNLIYETKKNNNLRGHLVCEDTGKIINIDVSKIKNIDLGLPTGFNIKKVEVIFYGNFQEGNGDCKGKIVMQ